MTDSPEAFLEGLNEEQREAATATSGPVVIHAGAGTGKTRVISHRVAYAAAMGALDPKRLLILTFTDKAAGEMKRRLGALGQRSAVASTFHAAAKRQLEFHWPRVHGRPLPTVLDSKFNILIPIARQLPGGYKFTPAKDLADEIEWAKNRRINPEEYPAEAASAGRVAPIPPDLFRTVFERYEHGKKRAGAIDFEDMLEWAIDLYETDNGAVELVRKRYAWFSVDEYQDTNRLQDDLLRLWLGDRRELCVVGDEDQTIYSFTGASAKYLTGFTARYPEARVIRLTQNYRSSPQILAVANRLIRSKQLRAILPAGEEPEFAGYPDGEAEVGEIIARVRSHMQNGVPATEIAILVRTNAQLLPFESALTGAGIPFTVRGQRFFARPEVRAAIQASSRLDQPGALTDLLSNLWRTTLGFDENETGGPGTEARERHASLVTLLGIARQLEAGLADATVDAFLAEMQRRDQAEKNAAGEGVVLSTYHRAKGLEWDVVFLPTLEEGTLPIRQAFDAEDAIREEKRLLYVGITRARHHLLLSWAVQRTTARGHAVRARQSRFIAQLRPPHNSHSARSSGILKTVRSDLAVGDRVTHVKHGSGQVKATQDRTVTVEFHSGVIGSVSIDRLTRSEPARRQAGGRALTDVSGSLLDSMKAWRLERSRADSVPAFVIAHNTTLDAIARREPRTLAELLGVPGMGKNKVATYGDEILTIIRNAAERR